MKFFFQIASCAFVGIALVSCGTAHEKISHAKFHEEVSALYDSTLKPFYHGVASGDPLTDRVVIWTRVTPEDSVASIPVIWEVSESENFNPVLYTDSTSTSSARDYTVKVDVANLKPGKFYYYRFKSLGKTSVVGRTKTISLSPDSLHFAVVSCNNWEFGYFNAYNGIAKKDLDAVIHLGDYIYEYATGKYGDTTIGRLNIPLHEVVSLHDYRTRYSLYHLDKALRRARQVHPFITIWDDHEVANNVYTEGAQNHQTEEGDFTRRKEAAKKAYYEWIPIREEGMHYREFSYGQLADLIMLDERLAGRTKPVDSASAPDYNDAQRTMLGSDQHIWLEHALTSSKATWKLIGNQVMFSDLNTTAVHGSAVNLDAWDGYPAEKKKIVDVIRSNNLNNIILLTGDTHASWAIEAATDIRKSYNPKTGAGAFAVELGTTSISSGNADEHGIPVDTVIAKEVAIMKANPHVKYVDDRDHGYLFIAVTPEKIRSEWWFVKTLREESDDEFLGKRFIVKKGSNKLQ